MLVIFRESLTLLFGADPLPSPPPFGFKRVVLGLFAAVIHWSIRERPVPRLAPAAMPA